MIPSRARLQVDCRVPPGLGEDHARERDPRGARASDGYRDRVRRDGGGQPLADRHAADGRDPRRSSSARTRARAVVPVVLPGFTDSRWFREAFPDCVAYGFFPQRTMDLFEATPLDPRRRRARAASRTWASPRASTPTWPRRCSRDRAEPDDKLRLGGMALRNGLLVHGPTHWAAAVRTDAGEIAGGLGPQAELRRRAAERVPGLRGVAQAGRGDGGDPARQARAARGAAADAGRAARSARWAPRRSPDRRSGSAARAPSGARPRWRW